VAFTCVQPRCGVTDHHPFLRLALIYFPLWTAIVFNVVTFAAITRVLSASLRSVGEGDEGEGSSLLAVETRAVVARLKWLPLTFVLVRLGRGCPDPSGLSGPLTVALALP
jgi:hypothetical protein